MTPSLSKDSLSCEADMQEKNGFNLASFTKGEFVSTLDPGIAGMALFGHDGVRQVFKCRFQHTHHDATGLGERSTSTKHILQDFEYVEQKYRAPLTGKKKNLPTVASNGQSSHTKESIQRTL